MVFTKTKKSFSPHRPSHSHRQQQHNARRCTPPTPPTLRATPPHPLPRPSTQDRGQRAPAPRAAVLADAPNVLTRRRHHRSTSPAGLSPLVAPGACARPRTRPLSFACTPVAALLVRAPLRVASSTTAARLSAARAAHAARACPRRSPSTHIYHRGHHHGSDATRLPRVLSTFATRLPGARLDHHHNRGGRRRLDCPLPFPTRGAAERRAPPRRALRFAATLR